jgi:hypothetical protein
MVYNIIQDNPKYFFYCGQIVKWFFFKKYIYNHTLNVVIKIMLRNELTGKYIQKHM